MTTPIDWFRNTDNVLDVLRGERIERRTLPTIPGYEDIEEISRGGQGVVYSAIQRSTHRRVALKVLLHGAYVTAASLRRFEREIELVAALRHPNIVRVYDSGISDEGRPYCVMEFIEGEALDLYVRTHKLSVPDTLKLFLEIADAVHHAHQHGVMHRDLKPSNIRVDASGRPHILDFGLAKPAGDGSPLNATTVTVSQPGHFLGSLPWASPEQVRGSAEGIDLRCDVYSLGVNLYQLLAGRFPYDVSGPMHEVAHRILTADPARPSRPNEKLHDDLCTITLKALAKDPDRRYQTAGELAADLRRYMNGEPIEARADSTWYVLRKSLHRYRYAAWTLAALIILLAGFGVTMSIMYQQTERARNRAQAEAEKATAINEFLSQLITSVDPSRNGYRATMAEVLDQAAHEIPVKFARQPVIEAALQHALGKAFYDLGRYDEGQTHFARALALRRQYLGEDHLDTLETEELIISRLYSGPPPQLKAAAASCRHIFQVRLRTLGPDNPGTLNIELLLRRVEAELDCRQNLPTFRATLARAEKVFGAKSRIVVNGEVSLSTFLSLNGQPAEAEQIARRALAATETYPDPEDHDKINAMIGLGTALISQKRYDEALPIVKFPYDVKARVLGARHPATLISARQLMELYRLLGKPHEAESLAEASGIPEPGE